MRINYGDVIGIDPTKAAIDGAKELFPQCKLICEDTKWLLKNNGVSSFDLVISTEVIEHIPDEDKMGFIKSIYKLLDYRGFAILTAPRGELWRDWKRLGKEQQPIEQWISETSLDKLNRSAGFKILKRDRVYLSWFRFNLVSRIIASKSFPWLK